MLRIVLINFILFALPFILYFLWFQFRGKKPDSEVPFLWLMCAGVVLVVVGIATLIQFETGDPGSVYVPPQLINGEIVPGHFDPAPDAE